MHLNNCNNAIVDNALEFIADVFSNFLFSFFLYRPDSLRLDQNLISNRWQTQNPPGGSIILRFFSKNVFASRNDVLILLLGLLSHLFLLADKINSLPIKHTINIKGEIIDLSQPKVMGIINVTPDSFFSGSRKQNINEILGTAEKMLDEGADFLDVGGYSSRPGATDIVEEEEKRRVVEAVEALVKEFPDALISIDTFRSAVAEAAIGAGASMINDISAGHLDLNMLEKIAELNVPYVAMHMRGTPQVMKDLTEYDDLLLEVISYFSDVQNKCRALGVKDLIIDPGFGFAKTSEQSFHLLNNLERLQALESPILVGLSRKSMIYQSLNLTADEALNGTTALNTLALLKGAGVLRVHDIKEAVEVVKLVNQLS